MRDEKPRRHRTRSRTAGPSHPSTVHQEVRQWLAAGWSFHPFPIGRPERLMELTLTIWAFELGWTHDSDGVRFVSGESGWDAFVSHSVRENLG